ncbi:hypothetical protein LEP1GSC020_3261 [Leptospira interrogans serovar Grippotyphosa str. 2006006986]|uniref:Uncharacterized protein n=3 Tax=Leptospira interrogans TaxID=173 RepID=A0A0E2D792_LEPIR|nr:hypothetical protein LEP1GSC045_0448 [Leptospira interrogans serovar Pomona str. Kennewicki LC82-25]EJP17289.1 hypothetical protein LEP1GSC080_3186 [Leptospira interrogans str. FPW2026]EKN95968.1 hypothetical protein LEP1GSC014_4416 [Leptospira interrogans serovar Pomona str. Pomona]EKO70207.1 hypothetical protein LEP1GSC069_2830 [Leptospira interrogans serovar Canicola str. Fiocruz LV133]EKO89167.1 hypothetical protein LEP1GSC009_4226 [Leptospira interrogans serovar Grippotyphosa str. Andam
MFLSFLRIFIKNELENGPDGSFGNLKISDLSLCSFSVKKCLFDSYRFEFFH